MNRSNAAAAFADEPPTRQMPKFVLEEEARRLDLACVFAAAPARKTSDDEPTLDAPVPVEVTPEAVLSLGPVAPMYPCAVPELDLQDLDLPLPEPLAPPRSVSGFQLRVSPELVKATEELRAAEERRMSEAPTPAPVSALAESKRSSVTYVVAGIWATALSLVALLMFIAST